jgi:hypothetical protein
VTSLSFTDANYVDVSLNGVALVSGTDYTATPSTNTISGLAALTASDVVEIVVYDTFSVFGGSVNGDFNISGGTLSAEAVTVTGLTTTGNINFGDNDKANFGAGSDLQIYHDGSNSYIQDTATGQLLITAVHSGWFRRLISRQQQETRNHLHRHRRDRHGDGYRCNHNKQWTSSSIV